MSNIEVTLPAVDGSLYCPHEFGESCKLAIHTLISDDFAAPPQNMVIEVKTESGKSVKVYVPYDRNLNASVTVDGEAL
ncbi:hypothetical protein [Agarilytica rhodophyticola]|uniref:hypothetical protein n=1 Tax=Agarilytica rhodophyticola TaxID=1737490 RepID=UPI000B344CB8|nr:hypothetical protein [Agarilytica rhodophyticola]